MKRGTHGVGIVNVVVVIATGRIQYVRIVEIVIVAGAQPGCLLQNFCP